MPRKYLAPTGEAFCNEMAKFGPDLGYEGERGIVGLLEKLGKVSGGYGEVWTRFVGALRAEREKILQRLGESMPPEQFDDLIGRLDAIGPSNARRRMRELGVIIRPPEERAIPMAYAKIRKKTSPVPVGNEELRGFLQGIYAVDKTAIGTLNKIADILEDGEGERDEEITFLVGRLRVLAKSVGFKILRRYGVVLDPWEKAIRKTQFKPGDRETAIRARKIQFEKRARLSPMLREKGRIKDAEARGLPHPGRRKDIQDMDGHHPYLLGTCEANLARQLTEERKEWVYRPHATVIEVPSNERARVGGKGVLYFEPAFYVPKDREYLVVVQDGRERQERGRKNGRGEEGMEGSQREAEIVFIQEKIPNCKITAVHSSERRIAKGRERIDKRRGGWSPVRRKNSRKIMETVHRPNITTDPDLFLLAVDACPCAQCSLDYRNTPPRTPQEFPGHRHGPRRRPTN